MGYMIELSINMKKTTNLTQLKDDIICLANKNNCTFFYDTFEYIVSNRYFYRNHYIISLEFPDDDDKLISFIREIKKNKKIYIENLNYENLQCKIMYASKKYLNMMEKEQAKSYLKARREGSLFKYNSKIMKELRKKQK